ncbi:MAG: hypothetical protein AAF975_01525 [Spirochaetota bacterium]
MEKRKALPTCQKCRSYKVTWDSRQPHACRFFGFKSYLLPAQEVYNSTGMACPQYRLAPAHMGASPGRRQHLRQPGQEGNAELLDSADSRSFVPDMRREASLELRRPVDGAAQRIGETRETPKPSGKTPGKPARPGQILGERGILL